jgi:hypothetical protein
LKHRHAPDHNCSSLNPKIAQSKKIINKSPPTIKSKKLLSPAVQLMKLKLSAKGDLSIPNVSKYYLLVFYQDMQYPMFFNEAFLFYGRHGQLEKSLMNFKLNSRIKTSLGYMCWIWYCHFLQAFMI